MPRETKKPSSWLFLKENAKDFILAGSVTEWLYYGWEYTVKCIIWYMVSRSHRRISAIHTLTEIYHFNNPTKWMCHSVTVFYAIDSFHANQLHILSNLDTLYIMPVGSANLKYWFSWRLTERKFGQNEKKLSWITCFWYST